MSYEQMIGTYVIITGIVYRSPDSFLWPIWALIYTIGFTVGWFKGALSLTEDD